MTFITKKILPPTNGEIRDLAEEIKTEAAALLILEPGHTTGPPAMYAPQGPNDGGLDLYKSQFQAVSDVFERFLEPKTSLFKSLNESLNSEDGLASEFNITDSGDGLTGEQFPGIDHLQSAVLHSDGEVFNNFSDHFLDSFDLIWKNHAAVVNVLAVTASGVAAAYDQARIDLDWIGQVTLKLIKEAGEHNPLDGQKHNLEVISKVTGVLSAVPEPRLSLVFKVASGTTKFLSYTTDSEKNDGHETDGEFTVTGTDAVAITNSMLVACSVLESKVESALNHLKSKLGTFNNELSKPQVRKYFVTPDVHFPDRSDV